MPISRNVFVSDKLADEKQESRDAAPDEDQPPPYDAVATMTLPTYVTPPPAYDNPTYSS